MKAHTPMLRQYFETKARYPGVLLAMRVGDFYEFYGEDAETAARELGITLTGRDDGKHGRVAMAGVPYHAVEKYVAKLIRAGYKVALCDQVEDPKKAKGLVRREVTRVISAGTALEDEILEQERSNFLASAVPTERSAGLAFLDLSTGEFLVTEVSGEDATERTLHEIARLNPSELLLPEEAEELQELIRKLTNAVVTKIASPNVEAARQRLLEQFKTTSLQPFGLEDLRSGTQAAATILSYLDENRVDAQHIDHVVTYTIGDAMRLDMHTVRSLELTQNLVDGSKRMTLFEVLDDTKTPMGRRLLQRWILEPLLDAERILQRHDAVAALKSNSIVREKVRELLGQTYDIERITARAATGTANARDLVALARSLESVPLLQDQLRLLRSEALTALAERLDPCEEIRSELKRALSEDPPISVREGGLIRAGYDSELDALRSLATEGKEYIARLEASERERTGIERLKVGFNSVFGYYLEVPKSQLAKVPQDYIRKQTTANAERYITAELKEYESKVLGSEEKACELEYEIFQTLRSKVASAASRLLKTARAVAETDVLQSFGTVSSKNHYERPTLLASDKPILKINKGRHPVVEAHLGFHAFVPNDVNLSLEKSLIVLTGPNMSGKSTYLRQCALIVLMAQIGCFVPAEAMEWTIVDRVFARIGARDELASGQSTFMVEMTETANILRHATNRSLVILDEIGRGTSTFDGLAIAWAISEFLAEVGAMTLFATHYHQLNALADRLPQVRNYRVAVKEEEDRVIWLHKVLEGGTDRSYGIQVARMAGLPRSVLQRAAEVLEDLEAKSEAPSATKITEKTMQLTLFEADESPLIKRLKEIDTAQLTPLEALVLLDDLKRETVKDG
ncbi:MAG: DNA mismatch repair protein MutS [Armatimonadetes bacterium]|nr:MAG: DNA mismatch repair protein MutS [Armatimonadota bacterium]